MSDPIKYSFNEYSESYKALFSREKSKLRKIFPKFKIEHVGSTSIPSLGGKGIIDIAIKTPKNKLLGFIRKLEKIGYESNSDHPIDNRRAFLQRIIKNRGEERRIHVHLVIDETFWESFILFRDYLRTHEKERDLYQKIKRDGVKLAKGDAETYRKHKKAFLEEIMKKALNNKER